MLPALDFLFYSASLGVLLSWFRYLMYSNHAIKRESDTLYWVSWYCEFKIQVIDIHSQPCPIVVGLTSWPTFSDILLLLFSTRLKVAANFLKVLVLKGMCWATSVQASCSWCNRLTDEYTVSSPTLSYDGAENSIKVSLQPNPSHLGLFLRVFVTSTDFLLISRGSQPCRPGKDAC
jgi:hypothetical protein